MNKKNIVLVTWKGNGNYGTCLQSFALYKKIQSLGYNVSFLYKKPVDYRTITLLKFWLLELYAYVCEYICHPVSLQRRKRIMFQNKTFHYAKAYSKKQEQKLVENTDCFVTGSDQIWNTQIYFSPVWFLDFAGTVRRVAYASSIGTNSVRKECQDRVKQLLLNFKYIGVREKLAAKVLSDLTGRTDVRQVLDPTFLLTPDEWIGMSKEAKFEISIPPQYIFCYLIGKNDWYASQLERVKSLTKINNIIIVKSSENPNFSCSGATIYRDASPVEFVYLIQHAALVCTDSFHATALSINHSVHFVEFIRFKDSDEQSQNSRIYDVLGHYHLMDRIYDNNSDAWLANINYEDVQKLLATDRKSSLDFLINGIEN